MISSYDVAGMTCAHCVRAVTEEVGRIAGVTAVSVDLPAGRVQITSDRPVRSTEVAAAVDEAGYALAS